MTDRPLQNTTPGILPSDDAATVAVKNALAIDNDVFSCLMCNELLEDLSDDTGLEVSELRAALTIIERNT